MTGLAIALFLHPAVFVGGVLAWRALQTSIFIVGIAVYEIIFNAAADGMRPDPRLTVSEWADTHRWLTRRSSAEPGRWRTSRTPYLKAIMDALSPSDPCQQVVFRAGAQVGKSECGNNWIGYVIHHAPGPMLAVQPTLELAKFYSHQRIDPLIAESPCLTGLVSNPRSRDSSNSVLSKEFPGGILRMTGSNSSAGLRSMPARYLFLDEVDSYVGDVGTEGDPAQLAIARSRTFANRKRFLSSTPGIAGLSRVDAGYESGDQNLFFVPCPKCDEYQALIWKQIKWPKGKPEEAYYECEHCNGRIENHEKHTMLARGEWRPQNPDSDGKTRSFHLSSLYSPPGWFSWGDAACQLVTAGVDQSLLKVFVNTVLGESWVEKGDAPEWRRLLERAEPYPLGSVPDYVVFLTAGVDVQMDRIEADIYGWGRRREHGLIDHVVLDGDTSRPEVWLKLTDLLNRTFVTSTGGTVAIWRLAIDSGYQTQEVYAWARTQRGTGRVIVVKGYSNGAVALGVPSPADITSAGRTIKRGVKVWPVVTPILKSQFYGWLRLDKPTPESKEPYPPGYCHYPQMPEEYFKQLTAEQIVVRVHKGFRKHEWVQTRDRNEALDLHVYAHAAAIQCGMDRFSEKDWLALGAAPIAPPVKPQDVQTATQDEDDPPAKGDVAPVLQSSARPAPPPGPPRPRRPVKRFSGFSGG